MYWFCAGEWATNIARGIFTLALGMLLYAETESLWAFTLAFVSEFLVSIFLQGVAGSVVDRLGAAKVLLSAALGNILVIVAAITLTDDIGQNTIVLIGIAIGLNLCRPFIRNAVFVLVPDIAGEQQLEKLNALISIALQAGQITGMALAGLLLELYEPSWVVYFVLLSYSLAFSCYAILLWIYHARLKEKRNLLSNDKGSWNELATFVRGNKTVTTVFLVATCDYVAIALFNLLLAPAVKHNFDNLARWLTFLDMAFAIGAILGGMFIAATKLSFTEKLVFTSASMLSVVSVFFGYIFNLSSYFILFSAFLFGAFTTVSTVSWMSVLQALSPTQIKGRLASVRYMANALMVAVATSLVSYANDISFTQATLSAVMVVGTLLSVSVCCSLWFHQKNLKDVHRIQQNQT